MWLPGHGEEDYEYGYKIYKLDVLSPVDEKGRFTNEAGKYRGLNVFDANKLIMEDLKNLGVLLHASTITHSYPHCWRCKNPVIFRATEQWFISIDKNDLRKKLLEQINMSNGSPIGVRTG